MNERRVINAKTRPYRLLHCTQDTSMCRTSRRNIFKVFSIILIWRIYVCKRKNNLLNESCLLQNEERCVVPSPSLLLAPVKRPLSRPWGVHIDRWGSPPSFPPRSTRSTIRNSLVKCNKKPIEANISSARLKAKSELSETETSSSRRTQLALTLTFPPFSRRYLQHLIRMKTRIANLRSSSRHSQFLVFSLPHLRFSAAIMSQNSKAKRYNSMLSTFIDCCIMSLPFRVRLSSSRPHSTAAPAVLWTHFAAAILISGAG